MISETKNKTKEILAKAFNADNIANYIFKHTNIDKSEFHIAVA